ncbi:hypothetical protein FHP25_19825 [Vineibacter terrae]|uniref:Uncharacterized protein n=1 Tax=Vineibacter terrae TaxID=2586908 RepID=A0A5C8PJG3_9HYPH|nr:hypothetical protein FHP25_19825 [Vineibacter terrae]
MARGASCRRRSLVALGMTPGHACWPSLPGQVPAASALGDGMCCWAASRWPWPARRCRQRRGNCRSSAAAAARRRNTGCAGSTTTSASATSALPWRRPRSIRPRACSASSRSRPCGTISKPPCARPPPAGPR